MSTVNIHDKVFVPFISKASISGRVAELAAQISIDYQDKKPLFLGILNGSFIFAADLFREVTIDAEISSLNLLLTKELPLQGMCLQLLASRRILPVGTSL